MAGFDNDVMYATNVDFSSGNPVTGKVTTDGQLLIGSTAAPNIRVGTITSTGGTIAFTVGAGTINAETSGSKVGNTITGNSGGALSPTAGNWNVVTANSTIKFVGSVSTETMDFNNTNLLLGSPGSSISSANQNTALGTQALTSLSTGSQNIAIGTSTGLLLTGGTLNTLVGASAATSLVSGNNNVAIGQGAMANVDASYNIVIGTGSGASAIGNSNIIIGNIGSASDANAIRIGTQGTGVGQQSQTYLAGVLNTSSGKVVHITTPGAYPYTTLITDDVILVDTASARTITPLASPVTGTKYVIKDSVGSAATNNITITPSGKNIDGAASSTININYGSATIVYNGTEWSII